MKILLAKHAGFCKGVKRAVELAFNERGRGAKKVYTDGPLIHNRQMILQMEAQNIVEVNSDKELEALAEGADSKDVSLLIRAHGITPERRAFLKSLKIPLCDATCPDVASIAGKIKVYSNRGYRILVFGDSNHPEVIGLMGYAGEKGLVVSTIADCEKVIGPGEKICLVSQSTMFVDDFEALADAIRQRVADVVICNTICEATRQRQHDIQDLKKEGAEAIIVVGGKHSANTKKLVALAQKHLPTYAIETAEELDLPSITQYSCLGITAGASTPDFVIQAVLEKLEDLGK